MNVMDESWNGIWGYIYALTKDSHTTDDLTQDVFVRAYSHLDQFQSQSSYKTWLFTIARNICRDYHRSAFVRRVMPIDTNMMNLSHSPSSEDEAVRSIESHHLWGEIFRMKKLYREVVILHIREDLTFKEIALILDIPEVTVRSRYRRAIEKLRQTIGKEMSDNGI